jgi:t-SNARE complex subunit (syntaxin)
MEQCSTEEMCTKKLCDNGQPSVTKTKPARKSSERARLRQRTVVVMIIVVLVVVVLAQACVGDSE